MYANNKQEIKINMIIESYNAALVVHNKRLNLYGAIGKVINKTRMNPESAKIYILTVINMINGSVYEKGIQLLAVEKYISFIKRDFGDNGYNNAIASVCKHIDYLRKYDINAKGLKELIEWLEKLKKINPPKPQPPEPELPKPEPIKIRFKDVVKLVILDEDNETEYVYIDHYKDTRLEELYNKNNIKLHHLVPKQPLAEHIINKTIGYQFAHLDLKYQISDIKRQ